MAVNAILYVFAKATNSTSRPDTTTSVSLSVSGVFKDGTNILNPVIGFDMGSASQNPTSYNYIFIEPFNRYYFISNWEYNERLWFAHCSVDVLASYKTTIGNSTQYVLRSASSYDGDIQDVYYPTMAVPTVTCNYSDAYFSSAYGNGSVVVGIVNGDSSARSGGATSYYIFTPAQLGTFMSELLDSPSWLDISDISDELTKAIFNPVEYITSAVWYPFSLSTFGSSVSTVKIGWWSISASARLMGASTGVWGSTGYTVTIPKHPQNSRGAYLNEPPYSRYFIHCYPFGTFPIDGSLLSGYDTLLFGIFADVHTGQGYLRCYCGSREILNTEAQIGVNLPIAQITSNILQGAVSATQGISNIVSGFSSIQSINPIGELISDVTNAASTLAGTIGNVVNSIAPQVTMIGSAGNLGGYTIGNSTRLYLQGEFFRIADDDNAHIGKPLCRSVELDTLSGFIVCQSPKIAFACTDTERARILAYLTNGFYYE